MAFYTVLVYLGLGLLAIAEAEEEFTANHRSRREAGPEHITVTTILSEPYTMVKVVQKSSAPLVGNDRYEGFIPDLLRRLSQRAQFNYTLRPVKDGRYGALQPDGSWNGMIGEVMRGEAELAAAPITITGMRQGVVEFVHPFMNLGLAFVMKRPRRSESFDSFTIFSPVAAEIWIAVGIAYLLVALVMWGMNRVNPYEWGGRLNLGQATEDEADTFSLSGSFWFAFATLQWQGYDRRPRSLGARVLSCFWFAFVTLCMVTYTASLVSHMTVGYGASKPPVMLETFEELVADGTINYGCVDGGSTYTTIRNAKGDMYKQMVKHLQNAEPTAFVSSTQDGIKRARQGNYAFIMESTSAKYVIQRNCDLAMSKEILHPRSYGMVVPTRSKYLTRLNVAILYMHQDGEITDLQRKWWEGKGVCWQPSAAQKAMKKAASRWPNVPAQVTIQSFWGAIVLIVLGLAASLIVGAAEIIFYKFKGQYAANNVPRIQLKEENAGTA